VQLLKLVSNVKNTQPLVIFPHVYVKQLSEQLFFPIKVVGDNKHNSFSTLMFHPCLHLFLETKGFNSKEKWCFVGA